MAAKEKEKEKGGDSVGDETNGRSVSENEKRVLGDKDLAKKSDSADGKVTTNPRNEIIVAEALHEGNPRSKSVVTEDRIERNKSEEIQLQRKEKGKSFLEALQSGSGGSKNGLWTNLLGEKKKCQKRNLNKLNNAFLIPEEIVQRGATPFRNLVVGYFFGDGFYLREVKNYLLRHWRLKGELKISIHKSVYYLEFSNIEDRSMALEEGFVFINGKVFAMREWSPKIEVEPAAISSLPIWVTFSNIPRFLMFDEGFEYLASAIGTPLYTDRPTAQGRTMGQRFGRVCTEIEAGFNFPKTLEFIVGEMNFRVEVSYNWMPVTCKNCKQMGHSSERCVHANKMDTMNKQKESMKTGPVELLNNQKEFNRAGEMVNKPENNNPRKEVINRRHQETDKQVRRTVITQKWQNKNSAEAGSSKQAELLGQDEHNRKNQEHSSELQEEVLTEENVVEINEGDGKMIMNEEEDQEKVSEVHEKVVSTDSAEASKDVEGNTRIKENVNQKDQGKQSQTAVYKGKSALKVKKIFEKVKHKKRGTIQGKYEVKADTPVIQGRQTRRRVYENTVQTRNAFSPIENFNDDEEDFLEELAFAREEESDGSDIDINEIENFKIFKPFGKF